MKTIIGALIFSVMILNIGVVFVRGEDLVSDIITKKGTHTQIIMVTSLYTKIGRYPLLSIDPDSDLVELLNQSPYDSVCIDIEDAYAGGNLPDFEEILDSALQIRKKLKKPIWPRVNLNRIIQVEPGRVIVNFGRKSEDGEYFWKIKVMDIYNESGALSDFYEIWRFAFQLAKENGAPGVAFDAEEYNWNISKSPIQIAKAHKKSVEETVQRLRDVGRELADIASQAYPEAKILSFFTDLSNMPEFGYAPSVAYIHEGILLQAKAKKMRIELIEGGENDVNYVNPSLEALQSKIKRRPAIYNKWLKEYSDNFRLGGTITIWNDVSQITGWVKRHAGENPAFKNLEDFEPFLMELCLNYDYLWIYVPSGTDYNPFKEETAKIYNEKLKKIFEKIREKEINR